MLALAAVVVMVGSQLVAAAGPRPTARAPARPCTTNGAPTCAVPARGVTTNGCPQQCAEQDPEGQRNAPLGCALCLAVADWLNSSLLDAHQKQKRLTPAEVPVVLAKACNSGFEGFQLWPPPLKEDVDNKLAKARELAGTNSQPAPTAIWMERLRKECRWYVQEAGAQELYRQWRGMLGFPAQRLDLFLCKNSGWLRACVNLSEDELPSLLPPVVELPQDSDVKADQATKVTYSITRFRLMCWQFY